MAEEKDFFQKLSGEMLAFFEHVGDTLGDPLARDAVIRDLGGKPSKLPPPAPFPSEKLDAIKAYRDASHPSAEAAISAIADIAVVLDVIAGQIKSWSTSFEFRSGRSRAPPARDHDEQFRPAALAKALSVAAGRRCNRRCHLDLWTRQQQSGQRRHIADGANWFPLAARQISGAARPGSENRPERVSAAMEFIARSRGDRAWRAR